MGTRSSGKHEKEYATCTTKPPCLLAKVSFLTCRLTDCHFLMIKKYGDDDCNGITDDVFFQSEDGV